MDDELQRFRESWLYHATVFLFDHMQRCDLSLVPIRVSCGWPLSGGAGQKQVTIGQCFPLTMCADGVVQVFISPRLSDSIDVLGTLLHELIHASFNGRFGHRKEFSQAAKRVGLAGPPTATIVGPELLQTLSDSDRNVREAANEVLSIIPTSYEISSRFLEKYLQQIEHITSKQLEADDIFDNMLSTLWQIVKDRQS